MSGSRGHLFGCWCIFLLPILFPVIVAVCDFPAFVQSNPGQKDWKGRIKSQFRDFTQTITIDGPSMRTVSTDPRAPSNDKICLQKVQDDRFVAGYETEGQRDSKFVCLQFVRRSDNVVQIKSSALSSTMANVCDGDLTLDPWVMIDKAHVLDDAKVCPLVGGYGLVLYDQETYTEVCAGYSDNAWFESECIEGEGLYFTFRQNCIPNVLMARNQKTVCVANWTEEQYSFMVIRSATHPYMWIIRYPVDIGTSGFMGYLMKEMYATMDVHPTGTNMFVRMTVVQNTARPVTSLCIDEREGCQFWTDPCSLGNDIALTCPRTCGLCNVTRPSICSFQSVWQGDWIDASHGDRVAVTFEPNTLTVYYNRLKEKFHCIRWDEPYVGNPVKFTTYGMLVTEFENGCRPKYSCVKIVHNEQSPVMFLQLSSEKNWPFTSAVTEPVNCHNFEFDAEETSIVPNKYRSKHYKLLYSKSLDHGTLCNVPVQDIHNYSVTFHDDTQCLVGLQTLNSRTGFNLNLSSCTNRDILSSVPFLHHCIDSLRFFSSEQVIVTRTDHEPYNMFCWLFPKKLRDTFYLVEAAHCNENTKKRITKGRLTPFASFSRTSGISTTILPPPGSTPPYEIPDYKEVTPSVGDNTSSVGTNSTNPGATNPAAYASPIVVIAAIIFFVIFQIPCMCKNS